MWIFLDRRRLLYYISIYFLNFFTFFSLQPRKTGIKSHLLLQRRLTVLRRHDMNGSSQMREVKTGFYLQRSMQIGSSETLIGWKLRITTFFPLWDRMEGAWLWTQCIKIFWLTPGYGKIISCRRVRGRPTTAGRSHRPPPWTLGPLSPTFHCQKSCHMEFRFGTLHQCLLQPQFCVVT